MESDEPLAPYYTLFLAVLEGRTGRLRYVNAGHNTQFVLRRGGGAERLASTGPAAGPLPRRRLRGARDPAARRRRRALPLHRRPRRGRGRGGRALRHGAPRGAARGPPRRRTCAACSGRWTRRCASTAARSRPPTTRRWSPCASRAARPRGRAREARPRRPRRARVGPASSSAAAIYGAAAAWDAAQRGLSVALVEREDFGAGTSWNSLKTIHGGMRYLQRLDLGRCAQSARERSTLLRHRAAPLVRPLPFLVPAYGHGAHGPRGARDRPPPATTGSPATATAACRRAHRIPDAAHDRRRPRRCACCPGSSRAGSPAPRSGTTRRRRAPSGCTLALRPRRRRRRRRRARTTSEAVGCCAPAGRVAGVGAPRHAHRRDARGPRARGA